MAGERRRETDEGRGVYAVAVVAVVLFVCLLGMGVFFKITEITVKGNSMYTRKQILDAAGIEVGDSILFIRESPLVQRIRKALPYADDIRVIPRLPNKVEIEITESFPVASIAADGTWWIIDKNARVLEKSDKVPADTIVIRGVETKDLSIGSVLSFGDTGTTKLQSLRAALTSILKAGLNEKITWLDLTNVNDVRFDYRDFTVRVGRSEDMEGKLQLLKRYMEEHGESGTGVINLTKTGELRIDAAS